MASEEPTTPTKKDDVLKVVDETAAAVSVAAEEKNDIHDDPLASGSKRRFFPRVKHLLTREWESVSFVR